MALLKLGVELSEVRPKLGQKRPRFHPFRRLEREPAREGAGHRQKTVFIGSLNMDARSARTNSELGLVIRSPEIARQVTACSTTSARTAATGSRSISTIASCGSSGEPGAETIWHTDPETTRMQRFLLKLLAPFAREELL